MIGSEGPEGGTLGSREQEPGEPRTQIIIADDRYSETLANLFKQEDTKGEGKKETEIVQTKDLESALDAIEKVEDPRGVGVITDMYMPQKEGSFDASEGLKVIQEIFEFYGVNPQEAEKRVSQVKAVLAKYRNRMAEVARMARDGADNPVAIEILSAFGFSFKQLLERTSGGKISEPINDPVFQEFIDIKTGAQISDWGGEYDIDGGNFIASQACALTWGDDGGLLMGVRVAEEAHKKGLPVVLISGWHGMAGEANHFIAKYLYDKGVIDNPNVCTEMFDEDTREFKEDAQQIANKYSYFTASKSFDINSQDKFDLKKAAKLQIIRKSLEAKILRRL